MLWVLGISFITFLILGIPIAFVLGLTSFVALLYSGNIPLLLMPKEMFSGTDSFPLLAVPFFMLAGNLMNVGGITKRLINFCNILLGYIRGGLALVNVVASMFFAGITGAAVADTSALGSILIPAMTEEKYDKPSEVIKSDISIYDESGALLVEFKNLAIKRIRHAGLITSLLQENKDNVLQA